MPENRDIERRKPDDIDRRRDNLVQRSLDYLKEFEEQGLANVEELDLEGWALPGAAHENRVDIARALISRGDDVNAMEPKFAEQGNSLDVARLLIKHGLRNAYTQGWIDSQVRGWNLLRAIDEDKADIARALIEEGDVDPGSWKPYWVRGSQYGENWERLPFRGRPSRRERW